MHEVFGKSQSSKLASLTGGRGGRKEARDLD